STEHPSPKEIAVMIRRFFAGLEAAPAAENSAARRASRRRRPALEPLESRALLSFIGSIQRVSFNPQATDNTHSDHASSANNTSEAVWVNAFSATAHDIWAQRFDLAGHPTGAPIQVDFTTADSFHPRVAMDSHGHFVVTWEDFNSNGTASVWMNYFDASGVSLTGRVPVSNVGVREIDPDVAASDGSFVITWNRDGLGRADILAERFAISGGVPQGQGIFTVTTSKQILEAQSGAMAPDGRFDIAYNQSSASNVLLLDIFASQYGATGNLVRSNIPINIDTFDKFPPSIAMDAS